MLGGRATHYGLGERSGQSIRIEKHRRVAHHHDARSTITAGAVRPVGAATTAAACIRTRMTSGRLRPHPGATAAPRLSIVETHTAGRGVDSPTTPTTDSTISAGGTVTGSTTATAPEKFTS